MKLDKNKKISEQSERAILPKLRVLGQLIIVAILVSVIAVIVHAAISPDDSGLHTGDAVQSSASTTKPASTSSPTAQKPNEAKSTPSLKSYTPPVCTKVPIPYTTTYVNVTYLSPGQTQSTGGVDGYRDSCTASSTGYKPADAVLQPYNKIIYVGVAAAAPPAPTYSYADVMQIARNNCARFNGSSAYEACIQAILRQYGF